MRILIGTSGWSYKEWKGSFYPSDLSADGMLRHYAGRLSAVEINNTFYRMPAEGVLLRWAAEVPPEFRFVLKASRRITHNNRLTDPDGSLGYFLRTANVLGEKLGPTLFQCPPTLQKDLPRLRDFLALLPRRWRTAFEFRHASWFSEDVYQALRTHEAALVAVEDDEMATPLVPTAPWGYLRLRRAAYNESELRAWVERVRGQPWEEAFVFLKHEEDSAASPVMAQAMLGML
ncbi:MAG: DUF72 domain-containing protein [Gemmatimonadales bacterium]|nr:DUF72 domain-containing protein [Gemmatimonadales bacterium]MBA3556067.1 DUF72 domain-containing protein [Gemmatimonadales bacterium]MDQ3427668.1 DUF72 domain-containing protein [Gemmatimonadota bacterium]